jgi:hypothetical protein
MGLDRQSLGTRLATTRMMIWVCVGGEGTSDGGCAGTPTQIVGTSDGKRETGDGEEAILDGASDDGCAGNQAWEHQRGL